MNQPAQILDHPKAKSKEMTLLGHIEDLRRALIISLLAILGIFLFTYSYSQEIFAYLMKPVLTALGEAHYQKLHFTRLTEPFLTDFKVSFFAALILASPIIFYQIWRFVAPGLYKNERRAILFLVIFSSLLFMSGVAFAFYFVFPMGFRFFLSFGHQNIEPILTMGEYLNLTIRLLLGFGLIFEMPVIILALALSGLVSAREVAKFWRYALVLIAIISAVLTPPDVASMIFMMIPMMFLYALSILLAALFGQKKHHH